MHRNARRLRIGRGTRIVASVTYCGILNGQYAGLVSVGRDTDAIVRVIIHHALLVVPGCADGVGKKERRNKALNIIIFRHNNIL